MKRILFIFAVTFIGILASFFIDAFYGVLLYVFYSFASPLELTWGALAGARLSFIVAGIIFVSALVQKQKILLKHKITFLCLLFLFICYLSLAVRQNVEPDIWDWIYLLARIIVMVLFTAALLSSVQKLRIYILAVAAFAGLLNAYYGFGGLLAGSTYITGAGRIGDNNAYAVFLNTSLPFIYYAGLQLKKRTWRQMAKIVFLGNIIAVFITFSRGGFITLLAILGLILINIRRKWLLFIIFIIVSSIFIFFFAPTGYISQVEEKDVEAMSPADRTLYQYKQRLETLRLPKEEIASARSRLHFWKTAIDMGNANPWLGVGFNRYMVEYNYYDTSHGLYGPDRAIHNTSLSVLAETGYIGFFIFIFLILACLYSVLRTKRIIKICPDLKLQREFSDYCNLLVISLVAFLLGSFFVNCLFQEIFWAIITISIAMDKIIESTLEGIPIKTNNTIRYLSQFLFDR